MRKALMVFLLAFLSTPLFSQITKSEFIAIHTEFQKVEKYNSDFDFKFLDKRIVQEKRIDLEFFNNHLQGFIELSEVGSIKTPNKKLNKKTIVVQVDFFNFMESSSQKTILKAIVNIKLRGGDISDLNEEFSLSEEEFTSFKFKNLDKAKNFMTVNTLIQDFSKNYAKKIVDLIFEINKNEKNHIYKITSIGTAKIEGDKEKSKKKAILDALINGTTNAFGINVINKSEIIDYGDVTDIVKSESSGNVIEYFIDEDSLTYTQDGYCCLILTSLVRNKSN